MDFWRKIYDCIALSSAVYSIRNFKKQCPWAMAHLKGPGHEKIFHKFWRKKWANLGLIEKVFPVLSGFFQLSQILCRSKLWQRGFLIRAAFTYLWKFCYLQIVYGMYILFLTGFIQIWQGLVIHVAVGFTSLIDLFRSEYVFPKSGEGDLNDRTLYNWGTKLTELWKVLFSWIQMRTTSALFWNLLNLSCYLKC